MLWEFSLLLKGVVLSTSIGFLFCCVGLRLLWYSFLYYSSDSETDRPWPIAFGIFTPKIIFIVLLKVIIINVYAMLEHRQLWYLRCGFIFVNKAKKTVFLMFAGNLDFFPACLILKSLCLCKLSLKKFNHTGEGNGNLLQYSCLENLMDRWAWWATVSGVAESNTT